MNDLGLFTLKKKQLRGDLAAIYSYLMGRHSEDEVRLFSEMDGKETQVKL